MSVFFQLSLFYFFVSTKLIFGWKLLEIGGYFVLPNVCKSCK